MRLSIFEVLYLSCISEQFTNIFQIKEDKKVHFLAALLLLSTSVWCCTCPAAMNASYISQKHSIS